MWKRLKESCGQSGSEQGKQRGSYPQGKEPRDRERSVAETGKRKAFTRGKGSSKVPRLVLLHLELRMVVLEVKFLLHHRLGFPLPGCCCHGLAVQSVRTSREVRKEHLTALRLYRACEAGNSQSSFQTFPDLKDNQRGLHKYNRDFMLKFCACHTFSSRELRAQQIVRIRTPSLGALYKNHAFSFGSTCKRVVQNEH